MLLLPDVGRTWWSWRHVLSTLGAAGVPVAALDPRGVGASDKTPRGYSLPDVAADLAAVLVALGRDRALLVGHGWGGISALALAASAPALVAGLALVAAPTPTSLQGYRRLVLAGGLGARTLTPDRLHRWTGVDLEPDAPCRTSLQEWPGPQRALAPLRAVARHPDSLRRLPLGTPAPTTVVHAARDLLLPRRASSAPDVTTLEAGHQLPEERPQDLTQILLAAWERAGRTT